MTRIQKALVAATDTKDFVVGRNVLSRVSEMFEHLSGDRPAMVVADPNTFAAAGRTVLGHLSNDGVPCVPPLIFDTKTPHADDTTLAKVRQTLADHDAVAIAVGSGTINDLCKRASFELRRPYMVVATASSVDGYASFGAPISEQGFKKTLPCPAPRAILADTDVLTRAPYEMTAAGYADLAAKVTGGSDWIIADALGVDPILPDIWDMTQTPLRSWLAHPERLAEGDAQAMEALFEGLTLTGFAMQATQSSRPASGAEHLFSHVWEMSHVVAPSGQEPSHGFKVAIGTLASTAFTEKLFERDFTDADIESALAAYPEWKDREESIRELFGEGALLERILKESHDKHLTRETLTQRLQWLAGHWDDLRQKVLRQLIPGRELHSMFAAAHCPVHPSDIGLTVPRVAATAFAAQMIRSRYTALDLAFETGRLAETACALV